MNRELMEKIAAARWKKEFENLSSRSRKILKDRFVDTEKYVKGLEKGNENLIEKLNIKVLPAFPSRKRIRESGIDMDEIAKNMSERNIKVKPMKALKGYNLRLPASMMDAATTSTPVIKNFNTEKKIPNRILDAMVRTWDAASDKISGSHSRSRNIVVRYKGQDLDRRALHALVLRHEIDEIKARKKDTIPGGYLSHASPKVMHAESANIAFMPTPVKRAFRYYRGQGPISEVDTLRDHGGIQYGASPYYNKRKANAHHKLLANTPLPKITDITRGE